MWGCVVRLLRPWRSISCATAPNRGSIALSHVARPNASYTRHPDYPSTTSSSQSCHHTVTIVVTRGSAKLTQRDEASAQRGQRLARPRSAAPASMKTHNSTLPAVAAASRQQHGLVTNLGRVGCAVLPPRLTVGVCVLRLVVPQLAGESHQMTSSCHQTTSSGADSSLPLQPSAGTAPTEETTRAACLSALEVALGKGVVVRAGTRTCRRQHHLRQPGRCQRTHGNAQELPTSARHGDGSSLAQTPRAVTRLCRVLGGV